MCPGLHDERQACACPHCASCTALSRAAQGDRDSADCQRLGDRQANAALWRIAMVRLATDPRTRDYVDRRMKEGKTKPEAIRCLKRYIAREVFNTLPREALC